MKRIAWSLLLCLLIPMASVLQGKEYHVSPSGDDASNDGSEDKPFKTITRASYEARPGDTITVHAGIYRERVDPFRGGESDAKRIVYRAAPGEDVEIRGSDVIKGWRRVKGAAANVWEATIDNNRFGTVNPYAELISGDYLKRNKGQHTGMVYLNGAPIPEAASPDLFLKDPGKKGGNAPESEWGASAGYKSTRVVVRFPEGVDPNKETVEINVRRTVFYPSREGIDYITVKGFHMSRAACNWAPPTAEQPAVIGTHWSKGWIIEDNVIEYARCAGVSLGMFSSKYDNTFGCNSQPYVALIEKAVKYYGWNKDTVGSHIVRNNTIAHCGQAGVVGGMGAIFSTIEGNEIHDIARNELFGGFETACVKIHGAVDVLIANNHLHDCGGFAALWLDWMAQGTRVTGNVFHDNSRDAYIEVNHGPVLFDNNLFLSRGKPVHDISDGVAFAHNLFLNPPKTRGNKRSTPYFKSHSIDIAGYATIKTNDVRFFNNIFVGAKASPGAKGGHVKSAGNVYLNGARPLESDANSVVDKKFDPKIELRREGGVWRLRMEVDPSWSRTKRPLVTTELLGEAVVPKLPFVSSDGEPYRLDKDFLGRPRGEAPAPGPFDLTSETKRLDVIIWPLDKRGGE